MYKHKMGTHTFMYNDITHIHTIMHNFKVLDRKSQRHWKELLAQFDNNFNPSHCTATAWSVIPVKCFV